MISYTYTHREFKLQDNLVLFDIIKNLIVNDFEVLTNDDAFSNFMLLNDLYIEFLSNFYNETIDDIMIIEKDDSVVNSVQALINLCCKKSEIIDIDYSYTSYAYKLIQRFPLLRQILVNYDISALGYQSFMDDVLRSSSKTLTKKKENDFVFSLCVYE